MTIKSPSNLESLDYGQPDWIHIYNANVDRLNTLLLKIQALQDVKIDKLEDDALLMWDSSQSKYVLIKYD